MKYSHIVARFGGVAKNPIGIRSWRRVVVTGAVASSVLVANLTVVGVSASSADQNSVDTSRVIVFASPAVGSDANYSLTIPLASSQTLPPVSDGVASDSFTYSLSGANSAGCALNAADATISFASAGSCVVVATSVPSDPDATYQGRGHGGTADGPFPFGWAWGLHRHHDADDVDADDVVTGTLTVTVNSASQSIRLASRRARLHSSLPLVATGYLGTGDVSYSVVGGSAPGCLISVVDAKSRLSAEGPGTCFVTAHIAADDTYLAATSGTAVFRFIAPKVIIRSQTIDLAPARLHFGASVTLDATGYRGSGAVTYEVVGGTATGCGIDATDTLTATSAGTCLVVASIAASPGFAAASSAATAFTFEPAPVKPPRTVPPPPAPPATINVSVVPFAEGSDLLTPQLDLQIAAIAKTVAAKKYHVVDLTPFTDNVFTPAFNLTLNQNRAMAVEVQLQADLVAVHATDVSVVIVTTPATSVFQPDSNVTAQGRAYNRRVVATLKAS